MSLMSGDDHHHASLSVLLDVALRDQRSTGGQIEVDELVLRVLDFEGSRWWCGSNLLVGLEDLEVADGLELGHSLVWLGVREHLDEWKTVGVFVWGPVTEVEPENLDKLVMRAQHVIMKLTKHRRS